MSVVKENTWKLAGWLERAMPLSPLADHLLSREPLCHTLTPVAMGPLELGHVAALRRNRFFSGSGDIRMNDAQFLFSRASQYSGSKKHKQPTIQKRKKKENDEHLERNEITGLRLHSRTKHALAMSLLGNGIFSAEAPFVKEPIVTPFGCPV